MSDGVCLCVNVQLQMKIAEEGIKTKEFLNPKYGQSNFFMPLKYHGDGEVG
jgi:hypothetical protein